MSDVSPFRSESQIRHAFLLPLVSPPIPTKNTKEIENRELFSNHHNHLQESIADIHQNVAFEACTDQDRVDLGVEVLAATHLGRLEMGQDHHKAAARSDTADFDIQQEVHVGCYTVAVDTKNHNPDSFEMVHLGRNCVDMDSNDHLESEDARNSNFPAVVNSDNRSWENEEDGSASLLAETKSYMNAADFHRFLPLLLNLGFGSRSKSNLAFSHALLRSRDHGYLC